MVKRRAFLKAAAAGAVARPAVPVTTSGLPPRKVIVGTAMQSFWEPHPGIGKRLSHLAALVEGMSRKSNTEFGRDLDLAILPEVAVTGEAGRDALSCSVPLEGAMSGAFGRLARERRCYLVAPTYLLESREKKICTNAAVLFGRKGELIGVYRKVHLVPSLDGTSLEGGSTAGNELPVFDCDFGKLAIQICYDMEFDRGWDELARKGAELIAWPTQSPQTAEPASRAMRQRCYIVSSTWRNNASIFEPTGKIAAQIRPPEQTLVHELDLSYAILPWSSKLRNGKALRDRYGEKIGFRYYEDEDCGIFWSNDSQTPVRHMVDSLGLREAPDQLAHVREIYRKQRVLDY